MSAASDPLDPLEVAQFFKLLEKNTGIHLDLEKSYLISSRFLPLLQTHGFESCPQLLHHLITSPLGDLHWQAFEAMTTNETSFFRDIHPFEALKNTLLPEIITRCQAKREIHIWCAAAATGQEPYSVAILLAENFPELAQWKIHILATDICHQSLDKAAQGIYSATEIHRGLSEEQIQRHFTKLSDGRYQIRPEIRKLVQLKHLNLIQDWPVMPQFELILMRNVLIYFNPATKAQIVKKLHAQLPHVQAYLMLGSSESILFDPAFKSVQLERVAYYQKSPLT
jgi:chemotaxis protein methyltransferase CheR